MSHYHVIRHSDDDDPYISEDLFACLDYAATELDELADMKHATVSETAENVRRGYNGLFTDNSVGKDEMEYALLAFAACETYSNVRQNCLNMVKQHGYSKRADRAPIYRPSWEDQGTEEADARLIESAEHVVKMVNDDTPISITHCCGEMRTWPDHDPMHGGETYCADEYPDGYAYDPPLNTQDGPCGDH
jgi:hypothetical protein